MEWMLVQLSLNNGTESKEQIQAADQGMRHMLMIADIQPIYDGIAKAEVQMTADDKLICYRTTPTEQPESNNEWSGLYQNADQCNDKQVLCLLNY
ncbi:hypothetical protein Tco_0064425 [Tanacetum coccineum]